jgi:hypothetical protein
VIEVRDRNNLPVPGAIVTFSIQGGQAATFGGAPTVAIATNAAGQAAVTSLTPTAAGAFQIQVSAAFQGQIATATIAQTNVMTAAQAAAASAATGGASGSSASSAGGGGAASGGGGLSTTTLAVTGAAVAGGALAAVQITKDDAGGDSREVFTGTFTGQALRFTRYRETGNTACVNTRAINASVQVEFDGSPEGTLSLRGTDSEVSSTCGFAPGTDQLNWSLPVTGTNSAIRANFTAPWDSVVAGVRGSTTTSFAGERQGDTITGTLTLEMRFASISIEGIVFDHLLTGSFPLTLTRASQ